MVVFLDSIEVFGHLLFILDLFTPPKDVAYQDNSQRNRTDREYHTDMGENPSYNRHPVGPVDVPPDGSHKAVLGLLDDGLCFDFSRD